MINYDVFDGETHVCTFAANVDTWLLQILDNDEAAPTVDELNRMSDCLGKEFPDRKFVVISDRAKVVKVVPQPEDKPKVKEETIDSRKVLIIEGPCDILEPPTDQRPEAKWNNYAAGCNGVCLLFEANSQSGDVEALRREILDKAAELGATTVAWREPPQKIGDIAYALFSVYRKYVPEVIK